MACYSPLKGYKDLISGGLTFKKTPIKLTVACGQCLGCRVDHRAMWAIRIVQESHMYLDNHGNSWATLTYRDASQCNAQQLKLGQHIPEDYSLRPIDVSKFIRSLRKSVDHKIRYFYCGEYGELGRPHYHICLFNHSFDDLEMFKDDAGVYTYTSRSLEKHWPHGFSTVSDLNYQTAAYTAGYIMEKINGNRAADHYLRCDQYGEAYWLMPEFIRMSTGRKKPCGLGAGFYAKYKSDFFPSDTSPVPGHGTVQQVPRYYQNILEMQDPGLLEDVKNLREVFMASHRDDYTPERLLDKYKCARAKQQRQTRKLK